MATARPAQAQGLGAADPDPKDAFRRRLLDAMTASLADNGYANTTVGDIVSRARTSRRTFYQFFPDRQACFVALLTDNNEAVIRAINAGVDPQAPWQIQAQQAIEAWIGAAQQTPAIMLAWIRDAPGLGAESLRLQNDFREAFITLIQSLSVTAGNGPVSRQRAIMLLGGLHELTAVALQDNGTLDNIAEEAVAATLALLPPRI